MDPKQLMFWNRIVNGILTEVESGVIENATARWTLMGLAAGIQHAIDGEVAEAKMGNDELEQALTRISEIN